MLFTQLQTEAVLKSSSQQHGFVLVTAVIFLMVLSLLGVMAVRGSLFEERAAANDRDLALARENAELALRDAERDILGVRFDGQYCATAGCTILRPTGTRPMDAVDAANFWVAANPAIDDVALPNGGIGQATPNRGVYTAETSINCGMPVWSGADWNDGIIPARTCNGTIAAAVPTIPYGTFTNAPFPLQGIPPPRYLIEMFKAADLQIAATSNKIFFRITAVGFGRTIGSNGGQTSITLQSVFSPF